MMVQVISGKLVKKTMAESINFRGVTENISFSGGRAGSKVRPSPLQFARWPISFGLAQATFCTPISTTIITTLLPYVLCFSNVTHATRSTQVYGYGDRDKGVGYKILNWQVENTSVRGKWSGGFKHVGFWSTDHGLQVRPSPSISPLSLPLPLPLSVSGRPTTGCRCARALF
jgi:hypothetical protein